MMEALLFLLLGKLGTYSVNVHEFSILWASRLDDLSELKMLSPCFEHFKILRVRLSASKYNLC